MLVTTDYVKILLPTNHPLFNI